MSLPIPSAEQQAILAAVTEGHNIRVSAVAGSGKTTSMLMIGRVLADSKNVLALTYNARLKDEMRSKIEKLHLTNVEAHSYHAFFVRYYGAKCCTDAGILDMLCRNDIPRTNFRFGVIILDEVQDMTPLYFRAVKKLIRDMSTNVWITREPTENTFDDEPTPELVEEMTNDDDDEFDFTSTAGNRYAVIKPEPIRAAEPKPEPVPEIRVQLCLFGDPNQNIYAFKDADERFLTLSNRVWAGFPRLSPEWRSLDLSQSFRVTRQTAAFVNDACLGYCKMHSKKSGQKPDYLICNSFGTKPTTIVKKLLKTYKPEDLFIIAPSVRASKSPIKKLENNLVTAGYPCFVPMADDEILQGDVISGKIVFSSIHQTKGLERKVVVLYNFDESYFKFFNRDAEPSICPNELYVACTRAIERLVLIHDRTRKFLPFLDQAKVYELCNMQIERFDPQPMEMPIRSTFSVIDLTRHITVETMNRLLENVETHPATGIAITDYILESPIDIPIVIHASAGDESVADINGICLPAMYEYKTSNNVSIIEYIKDQKNHLPKQDQIQVDVKLPKFGPTGKPEIKDFLYFSNVYNSLRTGYMFKLRQIAQYNWMEADACKQALRVVQKYIPPNSRFERYCFSEMVVNDITRKISGCIDSITVRDNTVCVWEFKCVKELQPEHVLQVLIYMWLFGKENEHKNVIKYYLLNILTDTVIEIVQPSNLEDIINNLIMEKIKSRFRTTDDEFIKSLSYVN